MNNRWLLPLCIIALQPMSHTSDLMAQEQDNSDFGISYSIGAEKKISKKLEAGLEFNTRTQYDNSEIERWSLGASLGYKLYNTKKTDIKLTAGWEFIRQYTPENMDFKECTLYDAQNDTWYKGYFASNYNHNLPYWRSRHRTSIGISGSYKPGKRWNISLKEAIQYNHYAPSDSFNVEKMRIRYNDDDETYYTFETIRKIKPARDLFLLRSKLNIQYNIRHSIFSPFASVDHGCGLNYSTSKWKITGGTGIKIQKSHNIDLYYRYQTENDDDEPNGHVVGLGYTFKF